MNMDSNGMKKGTKISRDLLPVTLAEKMPGLWDILMFGSVLELLLQRLLSEEKLHTIAT